MMRDLKLMVASILAVVSFVGSPDVPATETTTKPMPTPLRAVVHADPEKIRAHVKFLASDLLEGRGTGQRGGDIAAEYIATQLASYGLRPQGKTGPIFRTCRWWRSKRSARRPSI